MNRQNGRGIGADAVKRGMSQRDLSGIAHEHIERDGQKGVDADKGENLKIVGVFNRFSADDYDQCEQGVIDDVADGRRFHGIKSA